MKRKSSTRVALILPDVHLSPASTEGIKPIDAHDPKALSIAFQIAKDLNPDVVAQIGDLHHMGYLSGFARKKDQLGRSPAQNGETIDQTLDRDIELGKIFWDILQKNTKAEEYLQFEGNHDEILRIARQMAIYRPYVTKNWFLENALNLKERGIKWIPYQRYDEKPNWYDFGKLRIIHGQYAGTNHLKAHHEAYGKNIMFGHLHTVGSASYQTPDSLNGAWTIGCLCSKTASYHRGRTNSWQQAFAVVYQHSNGKFNVYIPYIINGYCYFNNKLYTSKRLPGLE